MTKDELSQIYWLKKEIAMWQSKLDRLQNRSLITGQQITGMPFGSRTGKSKVEVRALDEEEMETTIRKLKERAKREEQRLLKYIVSIEDSFVRMIVNYRYIEGMTWSMVAKNMGPGVTSDAVRMAVDRYLQK